MSKQSSRIYGIKVKEHRNYYEYPHSDNPEIDISEIKIYYDKNATNKWIIKSNYNSIWYNGTSYPVGSIILAFKDGTDCTDKPFMLMAPHEEDGIIVNYFYRITGRFSTVPPVEELLIEQEDVPLEPTVDDSDSIRYTIESGHPNAHYDQLYVRKFVNDEEVGHQIVTAESIRAHQVAHSSNYYNYLKVFNALLFDWNGMLPRIEDSYTFTLYSNVTYLEITPTTYQKGWKIKSWNWDTPVNLNILDFSRQPEPAPVDEHDNIKFNIATNEDNPDAINIDKIVNNAVVSTKTYSASDILSYRNSHNNEPIVVYENLLLDFNDDSYPGYKFYLRANSNYLKYEDNWIKFGDTITSWGYNDIVNFEINDYSNRYENEIKENTSYNVLVEHIVWVTERGGYWAEVDPSVSLTSDKVCYDIFYDHLEMYYNNHYHKAAWLVYDQPSEGYERIGKLAIMWAKPFWVLITTADGVRWNGTTYKGRKLLRMWHEDEAVDMTMTREQSRKVIAKGQDYDDILYVITTAESSNDLTVIKRINDFDDDAIVFDPSTDCPVDFHNIRFTYSDGKIHIYSKCDFIYLSGHNYKKGKDIIDWPIEEKVNFGIKDETNAYEIINTATYTVKSEWVTVIDYDISTLIDEHWTPLKVCKIVNNKESDDEILYFYDCSINPFVYDGKLEISYDPASTYWTLTSLSDDIYKDNVRYPEGTVIATWPFGTDAHIYGIGHSDVSHYDVRLHSTEVDSNASYKTTHEYITDPRYFIVTQSDHSLNVTNDQPGSSPVTRNIRYMDAIDWYQFFNIKIKYDVVSSDWIVKSDSNELFVGQDRYKKGEIISKWDYYDNVDSIISVLIEDIKHTTREEKQKDLLVSNKSSWLYGYIWQKDETPPPHPWAIFDFIVWRDNSWNTKYARLKMEDGNLTGESGYLLSRDYFVYPYGLGLFYSNYLNECYLGGSGRSGIKITFDSDNRPVVTRYTNFYKVPTIGDMTWMYGIIRNETSICFSLDEDLEEDCLILRKFVCNAVNDILVESTVSLKNNSVDFRDLKYTKTFLINNKLYFLRFPESGSEFAIVIADDSTTNIYNYSRSNFIDPLSETIRSLYPNGDGNFSLNISTWPYTAFEKNGNIYIFIMYVTEGVVTEHTATYKPGLIKINPSTGAWLFVDLNETQLYSDLPTRYYASLNNLVIIESNSQTYLYVSFFNQLGNNCLYIYTIDIVDNNVVINRRNYFDGATQGHIYVEFKYGDSTARCYPANTGMSWNSTLGCYTFGVADGLSIDHQNYTDVGDGQSSVNFADGLLSNSGKANYAIGIYNNSNTSRFIARLGSLDLTPSPENQIIVFS